MYSDPYERFVHKPVERKPAPTPVVSYAKIKRHPPSVFVEPPKRKPGRRAGKEAWPLIAHLYEKHPTMPLSFIARRVGLHHTSVHYALKSMGLYVRRSSDEALARRMAFRNVPGHISQKKLAHARAVAIRAAGKHWGWNTKLDNERVRAIRHMRAEGIPTSALARKFRVGYTCIRDVVARRTWKHVP